MERIKNNIFFNLSNTMLKIIGLVCMTIDHLYLYVFANTIGVSVIYYGVPIGWFVGLLIG